MALTKQVQRLLRSHPALGDLFFGQVENLVSGEVTFDLRDPETRRVEIAPLLGGRLLDESVKEWKFDLNTPYNNGGVGRKTRSVTLSDVTAYFLVNQNRLVPVPGGDAVRRTVSKRSNSSHVVEIRIFFETEENLKNSLTRKVTINVYAISQTSKRRDRRDTGKHRRVA